MNSRARGQACVLRVLHLGRGGAAGGVRGNAVVVWRGGGGRGGYVGGGRGFGGHAAGACAVMVLGEGERWHQRIKSCLFGVGGGWGRVMMMVLAMHNAGGRIGWAKRSRRPTLLCL